MTWRSMMEILKRKGSGAGWGPAHLWMDGIPDGIYIDTPENRELIRKGLGLYPDYRNWRDDFDPSFVAELDVMQ